MHNKETGHGFHELTPEPTMIRRLFCQRMGGDAGCMEIADKLDMNINKSNDHNITDWNTIWIALSKNPLE